MLYDIYQLVIHNIKLFRERQDYFLTYCVTEFHVWDKVLAKNHTRDIWNLKYNVTYHMAWVLRRLLELIDEIGKGLEGYCPRYLNHIPWGCIDKIFTWWKSF